MVVVLANTRSWPMVLDTVRSGWGSDVVKVVPTQGLPFFGKVL